MSMPSSAASDDTQAGANNDKAPKLSALFLIRFDKRKGYTIAWQRSADDVSLSSVEFKSLPSGLHTVPHDLVYFVHEHHAGVAAFVRASASAEDRGADFISVGALVQKEYGGRLGRCWLLAGGLRALAGRLARGEGGEEVLEEYWGAQGILSGREGGTTNGNGSGIGGGEGSKGKGHSRARAMSAVEMSGIHLKSLPPYHPALSMLRYLEVFGPLIFRLQQAALLRKRILFVGAPPVRTACEFVYNLSVLSSISPRAAQVLSADVQDQLRLPALFSVGIHDTLQLQASQQRTSGESSREGNSVSSGWVACTTDEIIATKKQLYDFIVEIPTTSDKALRERRWPTIKTSDGRQLRASQRDLRRYRMLYRNLRDQRYRSSSPEPDKEEDEDRIALIPQLEKGNGSDVHELFDDSIIEPITWTNLAYNGFMWWASAGERHIYASREDELDLDLLGDWYGDDEYLPTAIIAYFHRTSTQLIETLYAILLRSDADDEEEMVILDHEDVSNMGLDTWSEADRVFVSEFAWTWFGRAVEVQGTSIGCCGVRIPVP